MKKIIMQLSGTSKVRDDMFVTFDLEGGGRVHIPPDQIARMWNQEQVQDERLSFSERNEVAENWKSLAKTYLALAVLGALVSGVEAATIAVLVLR